MEQLKDLYPVINNSIKQTEKGFFSDRNGVFYRIAEKANGGAIFQEYEYLFKKGFAKTERQKFFSNSDIKELKKHE
jgi:hypothetical protein